MDSHHSQQDNDAATAFEVIPYPSLLLTPDIQIIGVNRAYLLTSGKKREELMGQYLHDIFPDNPESPEATNSKRVTQSIERAVRTGLPDTIMFCAMQFLGIQKAGLFSMTSIGVLSIPRCTMNWDR